jgi:hypothetical protein
METGVVVEYVSDPASGTAQAAETTVSDLDTIPGLRFTVGVNHDATAGSVRP